MVQPAGPRQEVWSLSCLGPGRRRPVPLPPPAGTWHSSVADGATEAQGCVSLLELGVASAPRRGLPWTQKESRNQNVRSRFSLEETGQSAHSALCSLGF